MSVKHCLNERETARASALSQYSYLSMVCLGVIWVLFGGCCPAWGMDPLLTGKSIPRTAASAMLDDSHAGICVFDTLPDPLPLQDAVERALCNNPKTREAWAQVKIQAAGVGIGRAAYLPTVTASWQGVRDDTATNVTGYPQYSSNYRNGALKTDSVSLSWVLYDFGGRQAALANATALLVAAEASQQAALETAFATVAKHYYAAQATQGLLSRPRRLSAQQVIVSRLQRRASKRELHRSPTSCRHRRRGQKPSLTGPRRRVTGKPRSAHSPSIWTWTRVCRSRCLMSAMV
ncbi:TolC family protein [Paraburkholderia dipogonis]|uniref:TolC family protein n=1 Tax=Paraburkholderia dipogonis TaxID=1211383 RepID=UPI0036065F55